MMNSSEDLHSPFLRAARSKLPCIIGFIEQRDKEPSTTITVGFNPTPPHSPISPLRKSDEIINEFETDKTPSRRTTYSRHLSVSLISHQLRMRKFFQKRL